MWIPFALFCLGVKFVIYIQFSCHVPSTILTPLFSAALLAPTDTFIRRHLGSSTEEVSAMLEAASEHDTFPRLVLPLLIASGRRSVEILSDRSSFAPTANEYEAVFDGAVKKRGKAKPFTIKPSNESVEFKPKNASQIVDSKFDAASQLNAPVATSHAISKNELPAVLQLKTSTHLELFDVQTLIDTMIIL